MEKFTFTNSKGASAVIEYGTTYILESYDGLSAAEVIPITTRGFRQNGMTLNYTSLGTRIIDIYFYVFAASMTAFYTSRRSLASVFNPLLGIGTLKYQNDYITKTISVLPTLLPTPVEKYGTLQLLNLELTALDAFWYDETITSTTMTVSGGGQVATIANNGDWTTPVEITITGAVVNPIITLTTTGEKIELTKTLLAGEKLIINTAYGNKTVYFETGGVRTSAYSTISNETTFFELVMGSNALTFSATSGTPSVVIKHYNKFVGV